MTADAFLKAVNRIVSSEPAYREGGVGADGTCDCIGLVMGAMYACGQRAYDLHSSNYFARFETLELTEMDVRRLQPGMIVYKARTGEINARYQPGGRYYTGDLLDYYHAGVVADVEPLSIVHCTSTNGTDGIAYDQAVDGWTHCGYVSGVDYAKASAQCAVVTAPSGKTVNLRKRPDSAAPVITRVPIGSAVSVCESAQGWARVMYGGTTGYMMTEFLRQEDPQQQWVRLPLQSVLDIIDTLRACVLEQSKEESL